MTDPLAGLAEIFSAPVESLIVALGQGIAEAQHQLDQNSIATQAAIDSDPRLKGLGLQAQWYQFPRVDILIKLALSTAQPPAGAGMARLGTPSLQQAGVRILAQPVSASYQSHFNYNAQAASTITLAIVPVPPPLPPGQAASAPKMTPAAVQAAALGSAAKFNLLARQPNPALQFVVNYNSTAGAWFVLQYDPKQPAAKPVVVTVDDATGSVSVISSP